MSAPSEPPGVQAPPQAEPQAEEPPPLFGSWGRAHALLAVELALTVALLYLLGRWAA